MWVYYSNPWPSGCLFLSHTHTHTRTHTYARTHAHTHTHTHTLTHLLFCSLSRGFPPRQLGWISWWPHMRTAVCLSVKAVEAQAPWRLQTSSGILGFVGFIARQITAIPCFVALYHTHTAISLNLFIFTVAFCVIELHINIAKMLSTNNDYKMLGMKKTNRINKRNNKING